jgi:anaerobic selenocysteine-containing dehydrogenase
VLSAPNGRRIDAALAKLEFMVAVDLYVNETTRHAHYILPSTTTLEHDHYDIALHAVGIRNTSRWNPPLFEPAPGLLHDWQIYLRLISELVGGVAGRAVRAVGERFPPKLIVEALLRVGPTSLTVKKLEESPHGVDLGPLVPRLRDLTDRIELVPDAMLNDLDRLRASMTSQSSGLTLIGRRDLRSNNSWMHNSHRLVKGKPRCTLYMHPDDAAPRGLESGEVVKVRSRVGAIEVPVEVTDAVMPGVVSLPHGWGHARPGAQLSVASAHAGVSANDLTDELLVDESCGTAVLNGVNVDVFPLPAERGEGQGRGASRQMHESLST